MDIPLLTVLTHLEESKLYVYSETFIHHFLWDYSIKPVVFGREREKKESGVGWGEVE
jgi:hypothetical protein